MDQLEELFANRALLKKMSTQDHIQMQNLQKVPPLSHMETSLSDAQSQTSSKRNSNTSKPQQNATTHLIKPPLSMSSLNTLPNGSYSSPLSKPHSSSTSLGKSPQSLTSLNNSMRSTIRPDQPMTPPVVLVPEGYGCRIPKTFRRCTEVIKIVFFLLYIFGLPVLLYHLHTNLENTKTRIRQLNSKELDYLTNELLYAKSKKSEVDGEGKKIQLKGRLEEYKETSLFEENIITYLKILQEEMNKEELRSNVIVSVEKWLQENPEFPGEKCHCDVVADCSGYCSERNSMTAIINAVQTTVSPPVNQQSCVYKPLVKTYTRWGRNSCNTYGNTSMLYHGVMATTSNLRGSSGASYLCLAESPTKYNNENVEGIASTLHSQYIYGSLLDASRYRDSMLINISAPGFHKAVCSVCQIAGRKDIMIPGRNTCPHGWLVEYHGYIMAQRMGKKRTQFVCFDRKRPDTREIIKKSVSRMVSSLNFVESTCRGLFCATNNYVKYAEVACVVCSR